MVSHDKQTETSNISAINGRLLGIAPCSQRHSSKSCLNRVAPLYADNGTIGCKPTLSQCSF